jgi:pantoate--beta-alanine ligase
MTRVWYTVTDWLNRRRALEGRGIGFVPTMGALHRGHASLVERCRAENEVVVASIFVNPSQFNDPKDLERYPRTLQSDLALLEGLGTDEVLVPNTSQLYPNGYCLRVEPVGDAPVMEAALRPGHMQGVMTVVLKLLGLVRPDRAYFGEKDYQQLRSVTDLAREFFIPTEIVACSTMREESGLAESSRNRLLSPEGKEKAAWLFRALTTAANPAEARSMLQAQGFLVEYAEERWGRRLAAVRLEGVRLIDNVGEAEYAARA